MPPEILPPPVGFYTNRRLVLELIILGFALGLGSGMLLSRFFTGSSGENRPTTVSVTPTVTIEESTVPVVEVTLPTEYELSLSYGKLGPQLLAAGAIDFDRFKQVYEESGHPLTQTQLNILKQGSDTPIVINQENAYFLLNFFEKILPWEFFMNMTTDLDATKTTGKRTPSAVWSQRINHWVEHHWLLTFNAGWGIFVTLPFLAPVLMALGLTLPARMLYTTYSFLCHQLPERSWFLFGPQISYTQAQIAAAWGVPVADISHEMIRRQFIGAPELGWKIAWSDRMVAMYGSIFLFGLLYALLRQVGLKPKGFSWPWLLILIVPMAIDGTTHLITDALRLDFRDLNLWAMWLTGGLFSPQFYGGDMFGSLNSLLRLTTGLLFGLGIVGFLWPLMDREFSPRR